MTQVLVVGAGTTGLVLALSLARRGIAVRIIDHHPGPAPESRAMGVQARTLELYRQLGFGDDVAAAGIKAGTIHFRRGGRDQARFQLADMGHGLSPYPFLLCYSQDEHERFLVARLSEAGVTVEWGTALDGFTQDADGVRAALSTSGTPETCSVPYVVGCDGARSRVRDTLSLGFPGGTYDQLFYVADVKLAGGASQDIYANLGADGFALMMPVRASGMQRLIGLVPPTMRQRTGLVWADIRAAVEPLLGVRVAEVNWFSTYRVHHRVASHFRVGRAFIAGDAGHIHSPTGGQGMNTGIGDAVNLAWKLAEVLQGRAAPALLDTYEAERIAFARTLVATTDGAFERIVGTGRGAVFLRSWGVPRLLSVLARLAATRRMIFRTISQVRVSYRQSALSGGRAGRVRGGDRLPWVPDGGAGNFAPLRSLAWQVHVYGEAGPAFGGTASALGLSLQVFPWTGTARQAGMRRNAAYLVRPDGYIALAQKRQDGDALRAFAARWGLRFIP